VSAIVVTGAAGFIGSYVCKALLAEGRDVIGADNLCDAYDVRLKRWRLSLLDCEHGFHFHLLDVTDRGALRALAETLRGTRPEVVINLAARAGVRASVQNPWAYVDTNITGTLNLLELCRELGIPKFVLASSSSVYGASASVPYREDQNTDGPLSPYAASKKAAEGMCHAYHHLHGLDVSALRFFTVYGPAGRPDMAPFRFVQWISEGRPLTLYGDGSQARDFTYVDDIARGVLAALKPLGYAVINLGSDNPVKVLDIIRLVESLTGRKADVRMEPANPADVPMTWADVSRARELLGWSPAVCYEQGFGRLVTWYGENRAWASTIVT
jgi:nucleoside-diphosphate-sugar epimerase